MKLFGECQNCSEKCQIKKNKRVFHTLAMICSNKTFLVRVHTTSKAVLMPCMRCKWLLFRRRTRKSASHHSFLRTILTFSEQFDVFAWRDSLLFFSVGKDAGSAIMVANPPSACRQRPEQTFWPRELLPADLCGLAIDVGDTDGLRFHRTIMCVCTTVLPLKLEFHSHLSRCGPSVASCSSLDGLFPLRQATP